MKGFYMKKLLILGFIGIGFSSLAGDPVVLKEELVPYAYKTNTIVGTTTVEIGGGGFTTSTNNFYYNFILGDTGRALMINPGSIDFNNTGFTAGGGLFGIENVGTRGYGTWNFPNVDPSKTYVFASTNDIPNVSSFITQTDLNTASNNIVSLIPDTTLSEVKFIVTPQKYNGNDIKIRESYSEHSQWYGYTPYVSVNGVFTSIGDTIGVPPMDKITWTTSTAQIAIEAIRSPHYILGDQTDKPIQPAGDYITNTELNTTSNNIVAQIPDVSDYALKTNVLTGSNELGTFNSDRLIMNFNSPQLGKLIVEPIGVEIYGDKDQSTSSGSYIFINSDSITGIKFISTGSNRYSLPGVTNKFDGVLALTSDIPTTADINNLIDAKLAQLDLFTANDVTNIIRGMVNEGFTNVDGTNYVIVVEYAPVPEPQYSGFIPTSDPLIFRVSKGDAISDSIQISGPPFSWFTTSASAGNTYSANGTFLFTIDNTTITVTADSAVASNVDWNGGQCPYTVGEVVCIIDRSSMIPNEVSGYFEWREYLEPGE